jgi:hypothetical protein
VHPIGRIHHKEAAINQQEERSINKKRESGTELVNQQEERVRNRACPEVHQQAIEQYGASTSYRSTATTTTVITTTTTTLITTAPQLL